MRRSFKVVLLYRFVAPGIPPGRIMALNELGLMEEILQSETILVERDIVV